MRRLPPAIAIAAVGGLSVAAVAAGWNTSLPLQVGSRGPYPLFQPTQGVPRNALQVAIDDQGNAMALWSMPNWTATDGTSQNAGAIHSAYRAAGSSWGGLEYLQVSGALGLSDIAMDGAGDAVAAWGNGFAYHLPGPGAWLKPQTFDFGCAAQDPCFRQPTVTIDASGNVVFVWQDAAGAIQTHTLRRAATSFVDAAPVQLSAAGNSPDVAADGSTQVDAAWADAAGGIRVRRRLANSGAWDDHTLAAGAVVSSPKIAVSPRGDVGVVWEQQSGGSRDVFAAVRRPGGMWGEPLFVGSGEQAASGSDRTAPAPVIAFDGGGNAVVAWQRYTGGVADVEVSTLGATQSGWAAAKALTPAIPGGGYGPSIAVAPGGSAIVGTAVGTIRRVAGTWGALESDGGRPVRSVAINPTGALARVTEDTVGQPSNEKIPSVTGRWLQPYGGSTDAETPAPSDRDNDGIVDALDACPDDPGPPSNAGCPVPAGSTSGGSTPSITGGAAKLSMTWRRPFTHGQLTVSGTASGDVTVNLELTLPRRSGWATPPIRLQRQIPAGAFTLRVPTNGRYPTGHYVVTLTDTHGGQLFTQNLAFRPLRKGQLDRAYVTRHNQPIASVTYGDEVVAHFHFGSAPSSSRPLTTSWVGPGQPYPGRRSGRKTLNGQYEITGMSKANNRAFVPGTWRCYLWQGKTVLGKARVLVRR